MDPTPGKPPPKTPTPGQNKSKDAAGAKLKSGATQSPTKTPKDTQRLAETQPMPATGQKTTAPTPNARTAGLPSSTPTVAESAAAKQGTAKATAEANPPAKTQVDNSLEPTELFAGETQKKVQAAAGQAASRTAPTGIFTGANAEDNTKLLRDTDAPESAQGAASAKRPENEGTPQVFGDYRLDVMLGEGGMGAVYKAHQISMDRTVALKMLSEKLANNQDFVARFRREAQTMAKVDHPNIVRGFAVGDVGGQHFVAMEFIDGKSMQKWMDKLGKLSVGDAVHVVLCSAYALQHAHEQSLVHRDIKPDNILITNKGIVKVADLGLAKKTDDDMSLTQSGTGFGTPYYMPLEQYRNAKHVDARADIYALGVTLYYLLTGKLPYFGETHFDVIKAKEAAKFIRARRHNPEIPERLDLMIDKMIQKERAHRYQSCAEVIEALEAVDVASTFPSFIGAPPPVSAKSAAPTARPSTLPQRHKTATMAPADQETPDMWLLRYKDERGEKVKKQVSSGRLKQLIERDEIDLSSATVARPGDHSQ